MNYKNRLLSAEKRAELLISEMSLREKIGQINQRLYGFNCFKKIGNNFQLTEECLHEIAYWQGLGVLYGVYLNFREN